MHGPRLQPEYHSQLKFQEYLLVFVFGSSGWLLPFIFATGRTSHIAFCLFYFRPHLLCRCSAYSSIENGNGTSPDDIKGGLPKENSVAGSTASDSLSGSKPGSRVLEAGEVAGDYSLDWKGQWKYTFT